MERFSYRESILLGYNPERPSTNPSTPNRNSNVDFHDVFGGPPRRSSIQEIGYSVGELPDWSGAQMAEEGEWRGAREKPVFGGENLNRRRFTNDDFYDDIFGGDESPICAPRKHERGSRIMSPALPLSPASDSFASSSLPSILSLPAKLIKGTDLPTFGSPSRSLRKNMKDGTSIGLTSSDSPPTPSHLSRFSGHATQGKEELNNGSRTHRQSPLSQEVSQSSISDKPDKGGDSAGQFHFSIHKWANKGVVPLVMPLRAERNSKTKENVKLERCSSAKDWIVSESTSQNYGSPAFTGSSSMKNRKQDGSTTFTSTQNEADSRQFVERIASAKPLLETLSSLQNVVKDVPKIAVSGHKILAESSVYSASEIKVKGDSVDANKTHKPESKPLRSLFSGSDDTQDYDEKSKREKGKESKTNKSYAIFDVSINPRKREDKINALKGVGLRKAASQGSLSLDENMGNVRVEGKVKECVRIFNQEALTKPRVDTKSRIQVSQSRLRSALRTKNEAEKSPEQSKKEDSATEITDIFYDNLSHQDDISASGTAIPDSTVEIGDKDVFFRGNFQVKELTQDENEVLQTQDDQEIKVIDDKIRQWSKGKEGNIRSLLSTLQYVLWPESGWKPVPLADIIEGNAVKRAYQRALLCLHPDKLQQKGAASHQKYIAEKVFDILQEAWTHFNMLGAL